MTKIFVPCTEIFHLIGKVLAQPNGGFEGEAKFKLRFKSGGAIDFGTAMLKAAQMGKYVPYFLPKNSDWPNRLIFFFIIQYSRIVCMYVLPSNIC